MASGLLTGYALGTQLGVDHTYVLSDRGDRWPCAGRSAGGRALCSGTGNIDQAHCLAQSNFKAGILYGGTGVCHQIANRILYPCGQTVIGARGYRRSIFAYGIYGCDMATCKHYSPAYFPWEELNYCRTNHSH